MRSIVIAPLPIVFLALLPTCQAAADTNWVLAKDKQSIMVFTRGEAGAAIKEFRGQLRTNTPKSVILAALTAKDSCQKWRFSCVSYTALGGGYVYSEMNLPWPLKDRYVVLHEAITTSTSGDIEITITRREASSLQPDIRQAVPDHTGLVEMAHHDGYWSITSTTEGQIVTYQMRVDPGGSVPKGLANAGVTKNPWRTLSALQELLHQAK